MSSDYEIYAFIDSQNLNLSVQQDVYKRSTGALIYKGWKLDFNKFRVYLKDKYQVTKAFLFIGRKRGNESLYDHLTRSGYVLVYKPVVDFYDKQNALQTKGNIDTELVLHTMINLPNFDKAVVVAGDGDYYCLIEYLITQNKLLRVLIPNRYSYSSLLKSFRHSISFISDLKGKLEINKNKKRE